MKDPLAYHYILVDRKVKRVRVRNKDGSLNAAMLLKCSHHWEQPGNRVVASAHVGPFRVSTIFLMLDHGFGLGRPVLFETMVFNEATPKQMNRAGQVMSYFPEVDGMSRRYCTIKEAEEGHGHIVARLKAMMSEVRRRDRIEARVRKLLTKKRK